MTLIQKSVIIFVLMAVFMPVRQVFAIQEPISDVRIVIDVSGSMKKNDPKNLRSPSMRMLVGLLPEGEQAGVWTFAKYVNMLVPYREVNEAWRTQAEKQSNKIHSLGLYTNIEQALTKATTNIKKPDDRYRRSVILLSDGLVDLSAGAKASQASRKRILDKLVPRLKQADVAVHTIALADSSDHELLRSISLATDGWYEQVDSAEQLQRVFLHLFEKAAQRDTVPLTDNHFKIDDTVNEMTLLVFRQEDSKPTELVAPSQSRISQIKLDDTVRWHSEDGYDLITIDKPEAGAWYIDADLDPDNRVMVVTDLKLSTTNLPNNILIGETFDIEASLIEKDKRIERQDFLKLVDAKLTEESEITDLVEYDLNDSQQQGVYHSHVGDAFQAGRNDVVIIMKSPTFERQRRQSINVVATPFTIDIERLHDAATRTHRINLKPDTSLIKPSTLSITAMLTASDGSEWSYEVMKIDEDNWQLTLADLQDEEQYAVSLQIRGETVKGRSLFLQPDPIELETEQQPEEMEPEQQASDDTQQEPVETESTEQESPVEQEQTVEEVDEIILPEVEEVVVDEMAADDEFLLPDLDDELMALAEQEKNTDETTVSPTMKLAVGNILIVLFIGVGIVMWRRSTNSGKKIGDEL